MAADSGERADAAAPARRPARRRSRSPSTTRATAAAAGSICSPSTTRRRAPTRPPYAVIDADGLHVRSADYTVEYADGANVFTALRVTPAAGGTGENLLRQTRMTGEPTLRLLFTDLTLHFDEHSTVAHIDGVKNGPVRAIRQVRLSIDLGKMFPDLPNGTTHTYHYREGFDSPAHMSVPWLVLKTLRVLPLRGRGGLRPGRAAAALLGRRQSRRRRPHRRRGAAHRRRPRLVGGAQPRRLDPPDPADSGPLEGMGHRPRHRGGRSAGAG